MTEFEGCGSDKITICTSIPGKKQNKNKSVLYFISLKSCVRKILLIMLKCRGPGLSPTYSKWWKGTSFCCPLFPCDCEYETKIKSTIFVSVISNEWVIRTQSAINLSWYSGFLVTIVSHRRKPTAILAYAYSVRDRPWVSDDDVSEPKPHLL